MKIDGRHVFPDGGSYIARRKDLSTFVSYLVRYTHVLLTAKGMGETSLRRASSASQNWKL